MEVKSTTMKNTNKQKLPEGMLQCVVTFEEAQLILSSLSELPLKISMQIFSNLKAQFDAQAQEMAARIKEK